MEHTPRAQEEDHGMTEAWKVRVKRAMQALGWPAQLMAEQLGLRGAESVKRLLRGGRPSVDVLKRLQTIEARYAGEIEKNKLDPHRSVRKAYLWPPGWVECNKRRWILGPESSPPARPADLAALGGDRTDASNVLTGWLDPSNFPGRSLRTVDWTAEGRRRYAADRAAEARRRDDERRKLRRAPSGGSQGKRFTKKGKV